MRNPPSARPSELFPECPLPPSPALPPWAAAQSTTETPAGTTARAACPSQRTVPTTKLSTPSGTDQSRFPSLWLQRAAFRDTAGTFPDLATRRTLAWRRRSRGRLLHGLVPSRPAIELWSSFISSNAARANKWHSQATAWERSHTNPY